LHALSLFTRRVNRLFLSAAGVLVVILLVVMAYDLVARNVFDAPTSWALDFARFLLVFVFFLAVAPALERGAHVAVDVLERYLGPGTNRVFRIVARTFIMVFGAFLMWQICKATVDAFIDDDLFPTYIPVKQKYVYWIGPLGMLQFMLTGLVLLGRAALGRPDPVDEKPMER
jgi:TRAP-type C4-dicarboxylate transport system permease small subunit